MTRMEFDNLKVVSDSLSGKRKVDEKTFASISILSERLEKLGKRYSGVEFSPYVKKLTAKEKMMALT